MTVRKTAMLCIIVLLLGTLFSASLITVSADDNLPVIGNVQAVPSSVSQGGYVNITCDVTDNIEVDEVWINVTGPTGFTSVNTTMNEGSYYYNMSYALVGTYDYFIWANDTTGDSNMSSLYHFNVTASVAPSIISNSAGSAGTGDSFVVNATVTDSDGVDGVWIEYWFDGGSKTSESMTQTGATDYYEKTVDIPTDSTDDLWYNISANDTYDVWSHLNNQQVVVSDDDSPEYVSVSEPTMGNTGDSVLVSFSVVDNIGVTYYKINLSGTLYNMTRNGDYCNYTIDIPSDSTDSISYNCTFKDAAGNDNISMDRTITVTDDDLPIISNAQATPSSVSQGGYVNITCNVTDNVEVDEVWVNVTGPTGFTSVNTTMNEGSYYYNMSYALVGTYDYFIWVNDTGGNINTSNIHNFTISPTIVWVDNDFNSSTSGWNTTYFNKIQNGINAVAENGTVVVYNGTYCENIIVNKTINLSGLDKNTTIIESSGTGDVISVSADMVNVTGFTLTGSEGACGIHLINAHNCYILHNNVSSNHDGIYLKDSSNNNISDNFISSNSMEGIWLLNTSNSSIFYNFVSSNNRGILSDFYSCNTISCNTIRSNSLCGILLGPNSISRTTIYNNYFDNVDNAYDYGNNTWNLSKKDGTNIIGGSYLGGNYWSDYTGIDKNPKDGLGDSQYNISGISGGKNADKYPLYFNATPLQNYENPLNGSTNISLQPVCNITVSDPDTYSLTVYFYENTNGSWILKHSCSVNSGSTATWNNYSNAIFYDTLYSWSVNVTDGYSWNNETYHFTTQRPDVVYVDDDYDESTQDWGITNFSNIQEGINAVKENGTVFVFNGTYYGNLIVDKKISITGEDRYYTIIDGSGIGNVVYVSSNGVNISGFTITNSSVSGSNAGIYMHSNQSNIYGNNISNNNYGIYLSGSSDNIIYNNFFSNTNNAYDDRGNTWSDAIYGNYWSDFDEPSEGAWDNNSDGIGDNPYNISGGFNNDPYPLMYQFDNYFTLSITAPSSINEGKTINVIIKNMLDVNIQGASVVFNSGTKITNSVGQATFTAPQVGSNTVYTITATKNGYIGDSTTITVKNINIPPGDGDGDGDNDPYYNPFPPEPTNQKPVADASASETFGFAGTPIIFDGSKSYDTDEDGYIASGYWNFGDGTNFTAKIVAHTYSNPGIYTVTLTVTDNNGTTDTCKITVVISKANRPPTNPLVNGHINGSKNTEYKYAALSTDLDDHDVRYVFDWDDDTENTITDFVGNGTIVNATHIWESAGVYLLTIYAEDEYNSTSVATELMILIDVQVKFIDDVVYGYLIDYERDGTYDVFHNNLTKNDTDAELQDNGRYLIDINQNGTWDYTYDPMTGMINSVKEKKTIEKIEIPWFLVVGIILIITIIILFKTGYLSIEEISPDEKKKKTEGKKQKKGKN